MRFFSLKIVPILLILALLSSCARDLSTHVYTSDSTLSLTLEGKVLATRPVIVKNTDMMADNTTGMAGGAALGGVFGSMAGSGSGNLAMIAGGVLVGAIAGTLIESQLGKADGIEYVVKVDTSNLKDEYYEGSTMMRNAISTAKTGGLITIVQGKDVIFNEGDPIYIIFSSKRTRIIARK